MKKIILITFLLLSIPAFAGTYFQAKLVKNNSYLLIQLEDDHLIPPFEAGELWKSLRDNNQNKFINEKEFQLACEGLSNQTGDTFGKCTLLFPYNQFKKIREKMVFRADGVIADRLNRYFKDSVYWSTQENQVYLSAYNTRGLFFFGINEKLIQK